ncbi:MAG: ribose 5-phosphate isomerase B [Thermoflexales bacterium]|nr:ribose 5-phosphate isomerase B [Thermoflexales bacterium]
MRFAIAADHGGFPLKATIIDVLRAEGHEVLDLGAHNAEPVDYPDYAEAVGRALQDGRAERGIVLCGSGIGASVAANKLRGIRAGVCHDTYSAHQCVEHDDVNVLCLGARVVGVELASEIVRAFVRAQFSGAERHQRRLDKVLALEREER